MENNVRISEVLLYYYVSILKCFSNSIYDQIKVHLLTEICIYSRIKYSVTIVRIKYQVHIHSNSLKYVKTDNLHYTHAILVIYSIG